MHYTASKIGRKGNTPNEKTENVTKINHNNEFHDFL